MAPGQPGGLVIAGAHGGSGCTTLAALLAPAADAGTVRPGQAIPLLLRAGPVVVTARGTAAGAAQAAAAAGCAEACGAWLIAVAVIGDGLPETGAARYRYRLLDARVPVVRFPFVAALRLAADPAAVALPRRARLALAAIRQLAARAAAPAWQ